MKINGKTKIIGIIGNPIEHTASPAMHNTMIRLCGLNFVYIPLPTKQNDLKKAIEAIKTFNFRGVNVTIPFKEDVMPFLDKLDPYAQKVGAVNTIVNNNDQLTGYNTDGAGFIYSLKEEGHFEPKGKKVLIFGSGGSAKSIAFSLITEKIKQLIIVNRTPKRAQLLQKNLEQVSNIQIFSLSFSDKNLLELLTESDLVINTTPIGMSPNIKKEILSDYSWVRNKHLCCDIIYKPLKTLFLEKCENSGAKVLGGAGMLAGQGALAFKLFTGQDASFEILMGLLLNTD